MGLLFHALFRRAKPLPLDLLHKRVADLCRERRFEDAVRELQHQRELADRHFENDETECLMHNGFAHYLALAPLFQLTGQASPRSLHDALVAFYMTYTSMRITLGKARHSVEPHRQAVIDKVLATGNEIYMTSYEAFEHDVAEAADLEANETISMGLRRQGLT